MVPLLRTALVALGLIACGRGGDRARPAPSAAPRASAATVPAPSASAVEGPTPADAVEVARGAEFYKRMCAVCHGARGEGYRADFAPALGNPEFLASVSDDFLEFAIAIGRLHTTMSAWRNDQGGPLTHADVRAVMAFLRSWEGPPIALDERYVNGDAVHGKELFTETCDGCHGKAGWSIHITNRQWLYQAKLPFIRRAITHGRAATKMVGYADSLGAQGVEDVIAYLKTLPSWPIPGEAFGSKKIPPLPLGPLPLNPHGPEPKGFRPHPGATPTKLVWAEFRRGARMGFLDARTPSDYLTSHIAGAVSVPFYDPTPYIDALPKTSWLVAYCSCPQAESGGLAMQLLQAGFTKVTVLEDGFGAWTNAKHPVHSGSAP